MESRFVIETVVAEYINRFEGNFISTIHDSIVVKVDMLPEAEKIMLECFKIHDFNPKLGISEFK